MPVAAFGRGLPQSEGSDPVREALQRQARQESYALAVAVVWMLLMQLACVLLWDAGWLTRQASLVHWLIVGVLPPALALWQQAPVASPR